MTIHRLRTLAGVAALALLAPAAALRAQEATLVAVFDPDTEQRLIALEDGQTLQLREGEAVRLQLIDPAWDNPRQQGQRKVGGSFDIVGSGAVAKLSGINENGGSAILTAKGVPGNGRPVTLTWEPWGDYSGGSLRVEVGGEDDDSVFDRLEGDDEEEEAGPVMAPPTKGPAGGEADVAQDLVVSLYRGILLREPDPSAAHYTEMLRRQGTDVLPSIAREIANSAEARNDVPRRASAEQRLQALYDNLLHRDRSDIDAGDWRNQLALLQRGQFATLVDTFVRSEEFASVHGLDEE